MGERRKKMFEHAFFKIRFFLNVFEKRLANKTHIRKASKTAEKKESKKHTEQKKN